jgi:hypothetical protein
VFADLTEVIEGTSLPAAELPTDCPYALIRCETPEGGRFAFFGDHAALAPTVAHSTSFRFATAPAALSCIEQTEIDRPSHLEITDRRRMNSIAAIIS